MNNKFKIKIVFVIIGALLIKISMAQIPASQRVEKITANWFDRAKIANGDLKPDGTTLLWYQQAAKVWEEALPIGNGKLGAMVFGGVADERIQLNESSLWDGYPMDPNDPSSLEFLPEVQRLLFEGKNNEAVKLAEQHMMGRPRGVKPYQSLGELWFDTPILNASNYVRSLDLSTAVTTTKYTADGVDYVREVFISPVDQVMVVHFFSSKNNKINFNLILKRQQDAVCEMVAGDSNSLLLKGQIGRKDKSGNQRGLSFAAQVKAISKGGNINVLDGVLKVSEATEVTLFLSGATNYPGLANLANGPDQSIDVEAACAQTIEKAVSKSYRKLKADHIKEHQRLFNRVELSFGEVDASVLALPTDKRLELARENGTPDKSLVETFFQFAAIC